MSLINFKKSPFESLMTPNFLDFDIDNLIPNRLLMRKMNGPALNIKEKAEEFEIELAAPGYNKKDFEVNIDDGCLNISATKSETTEEENQNYRRKEFSYNSFEKSLQLPDSVADDKIKAKYKNGILKFSLAKKEEAKNHKPKMIEIS